MRELNFITIIHDHYKTFVNLHDKHDWVAYVVFIVIPLGIGVGSNWIEIDIKKTLGDLIKYVAFFGAFLFNLLALMYSLRDKVRDKQDKLLNDDSKSIREKKLSNRRKSYKLDYALQIHSNISYSILVSIFLVLLLICYQSITILSCNLILRHVFETIIVALIFHYTLLLIMILKKVYVIMEYR